MASTNPFDDHDNAKSPKRDQKYVNPFDDDDNEKVAVVSPSSPKSTNPFDDEEEAKEQTIERNPTNPFDESDSSSDPVVPHDKGPASGLALKEIHREFLSKPVNKPPVSNAGSAKTKSVSAPVTTTVSLTKLLTQLLSVPTNRSCADCRCPLVDSSLVHASFSTNLAKLPDPPTTEKPLPSFQFQHQAFAPPTETPSLSSHGVFRQKPNHIRDPASAAAYYVGGHGVFLCAACGMAHHEALGNGVATVRYVQGASASWTMEQAMFMANAGGNARSWKVLEAYMPESWQRKRPTSRSTSIERQLFCRAKYEALAFVMPLGGPLAHDAWFRLVRENDTVEKWDTSQEFAKFEKLSVDTTNVDNTNLSGSITGALPLRLVDFFCVIRRNGKLERQQKSLANLTSPNELSLETEVVDCFPAPNAYPGFEFPEHISKFVFPDGCRPTETHKAPTFFTFVLTDAGGSRLYGAALHVYDESMEVDELQNLSSNGDDEEESSPTFRSSAEIVFVPKCLVVISHYGFFNLWRSFLLQIYRISLVEAPLPIERYIANFVSEVPLPPQGKIVVKYAITDAGTCKISRPPANQLPMADFSFLPLFASLSVENIMVVMACLLQEAQVALVCRSYAMLGPVAEALVSLLFPFRWQGIYIPVMPYSMLDILDAPIPFLIGLDSKYLTETKPQHRPRGVVFVDLDEDTVHLGFDPESPSTPRRMPALPERDAMKLKSKLQKNGGMVYLSATKKARTTTALGTDVVNSQRETYSQRNNFNGAPTPSERMVALAKTDKAYDDLLTPISGFLTENGQLTVRDQPDVNESLTKSQKKKALLRKKLKGINASLTISPKTDSAPPAHRPVRSLLDGPEPEGFSTFEIRNAWLRFFVSIFINYDDFVAREKNRSTVFFQDAFLDDLEYPSASRDFMAQLTSSQMFQSFVEERLHYPNDPTVRFFDESIIAKHNRSKVTTIAAGGKKETPFLDSTSGAISETFTPPPPSNGGLPDDGTSYCYGGFPKLDETMYGKVRRAKAWPQDTVYVPKQNKKFLAKQQEIFARAMKPLTPVAKLARQTSRDMEWAVRTLACASAPLQSLSMRIRRAPSGGETNGKTASVRAIELPAAQELIVSSRRKQGLLLECTAEMQALCRMYIARTRYIKLRRAVVVLQRKYRKHIGSDVYLVGKTRRNATAIQGACRGFLARKRATTMRRKVVILQKYTRRTKVRNYVKRLRIAVVLAQSLFRARRTRFAYLLLRSLVCKAQAVARRWVTRIRLRRLLKKRLSTYHPQMVGLWERSHAPLAFRTKFWPYANKVGFMQVHLMEEELERLWSLFGVDFKSSAQNVVASDSTFISTDDRSYGKFLMVQSMLSANSQDGETSFEMVEASGSPRKAQLESASERLQLEKLQIYEKLNSCRNKAMLDHYYGALDISSNNKGRKNSLINIIWSSIEYADKSASLMMELFPELKTSADIHFSKASKKGQRRLHTSIAEWTALDDSFDIQKRVADRIKSNMREFAMARLHTNQMKERKKNDQFERKKATAMRVHRSKSWLDCQHEIITTTLLAERP